MASICHEHMPRRGDEDSNLKPSNRFRSRIIGKLGYTQFGLVNWDDNVRWPP